MEQSVLGKLEALLAGGISAIVRPFTGSRSPTFAGVQDDHSGPVQFRMDSA